MLPEANMYKIILACCITLNLLMPGIVSAQNTPAASQNSLAPFNFYGHLNFGYMHFDDGVRDETYFTDNDNSNSRAGLRSDTEFVNGDTLRLQFEFSFGLNGSSKINFDDDSFTDTWKRTEFRKIEGEYKKERIGKFYLGQGSMATDGIAEKDLSGTNVINYSSVADLGGGHFFRFADGSASMTKVGSVFKNFDGARRTRIRYDTPSFSGYVLSVSYGQEVLKEDDDNDYTDLAVHYDRTLEDLKIIGGIGYSWIGSDGETLAGSLSLIHSPTGLNGTVAIGDTVDDIGDYKYLKIGLDRRWFSHGNTSISLDYYTGSDLGGLTSDSDSYALGIVQRFERINLEVFTAFRTFEFESIEANYEDSDVAIIGARWKF